MTDSMWHSQQPSGRLLWGLVAGCTWWGTWWAWGDCSRFTSSVSASLENFWLTSFVNFMSETYLLLCECGCMLVVRCTLGISVFCPAHCECMPSSVSHLLLFSKTFMFHMEVLYFYIDKYIISPFIVISSFAFMKRPVSIYFLRDNLYILQRTGVRCTAHCVALNIHIPVTTTQFMIKNSFITQKLLGPSYFMFESSLP